MECQYEHPMSFCMQCGTWMNCKRDGIDVEYRRRPDSEPDGGGLAEGNNAEAEPARDVLARWEVTP